MKIFRFLPCWFGAGLLLLGSPWLARSATPTNTPEQIIDPYKVNANTLRFLQESKRRQLQEAKTWKVFHDFEFSDHYADSGITFEHHVVDDAGKNWKPAHYDHGSA